MLKPKEIVLVNQINDYTCVHACMAMVTGRSIESIIDEFGDGQGDGSEGSDGMSTHEILRILVKNDILPVPRLLFNSQPFTEWGVYKIAAPSLNRPGRLHSLIVVCTPEEHYTVLDPQNGREEKEWYPFDAMRAGSDRPLGSYMEVLHLIDMA